MSFGRLERNPGSRPISEINMTPLIDVMLVLLVIFIITAPLMNARLALELPESDAAAPALDAPAVLQISIDAQGRYFMGETASTREQIVERARAAAARQPHTEVQLRADERVPYGRVAELIGDVQGAGLSRIGLVTEMPAR